MYIYFNFGQNKPRGKWMNIYFNLKALISTAADGILIFIFFYFYFIFYLFIYFFFFFFENWRLDDSHAMSNIIFSEKQKKKKKKKKKCCLLEFCLTLKEYIYNDRFSTYRQTNVCLFRFKSWHDMTWWFNSIKYKDKTWKCEREGKLNKRHNIGS